MSAEVMSMLVTGSAAMTIRVQALAIGHRLEHVLTEELRIGKEQWCVPAEQHESRREPRVRVTF